MSPPVSQHASLKRPHSINLKKMSQFAALGGFCGMALSGWILWFDVSSIGTMLQASGSTLLANLFFGGTILKGAVAGGAIGTAVNGISPSRRQFHAQAYFSRVPAHS